MLEEIDIADNMLEEICHPDAVFGLYGWRSGSWAAGLSSSALMFLLEIHSRLSSGSLRVVGVAGWLARVHAPTRDIQHVWRGLAMLGGGRILSPRDMICTSSGGMLKTLALSRK